MAWLWQDVRFGLRMIGRDPGFFMAAVLALALGIGSTTAIFSVVDNVLLDPFPYKDGHNLYCIQVHETGTARISRSLPMAEFLDLQEQSRYFSDSMGVSEESVLLKSAGQLKEYDSDRLTGNAFQFLGMPAQMGRGLLPRDAQPGAPPVFVLNYRVWAEDFHSDPQVIGKVFQLNGTPTTLVGVMPPRFSFWDGNLWRPLVADRADKDHRVVMYGHLRLGLSPQRAAGELMAVATRLAKIYPDEFPKQFYSEVINLVDDTVSSYKETLYLLMGAVGLLLLIACANVSNLLLAKAMAREKEISIRISLGSGRTRVIRQLLIESLILAFAGSAAGCLLAWAGLRGLMAIVPIWTFPNEAVVSENTTVLLATIVVTMLTGLLFGLVPAIIASRSDITEVLKAGGRGNSGFRRARVRNWLIVSEVALSLVLLMSSGLLMRSFVRQRQSDVGIRSEGVLTTMINLPAQQYNSTASQAQYIRKLLTQIETQPGVLSAGIATEMPPYSSLSSEFDVPGVSHAEHWSGHMAACNWRWFTTAGVRLLAGRFTTEADENSKRRVAVINSAMASRYFGNRNPIGQHLQLTALKTALDPIAEPAFEIVGIVADIKNEGPRKDVLPEAYLPYTIEGFGSYRLFLRTVGRPEAMASRLTNAVLAVDSAVVPQYTWTMERQLELSAYSKPRFFATLMGVFAAIGLILVSVGVYSVISYTVSQQRREIGIRMALGATAGAVRSHVVTASLQLVYLGVGAGLVLTVLSSRIIMSQVWGVAWYDPVTLLGVLVLLTLIGILAAYEPSVRASRVAPMVCLREE